MLEVVKGGMEKEKKETVAIAYRKAETSLFHFSLNY